jgi:glucan 1,3-beta-glucosidase
LVDGKYFTAPLPQYEKYEISQVASVKEDPEYPVYGDSEACQHFLRENR